MSHCMSESRGNELLHRALEAGTLPPLANSFAEFLAWCMKKELEDA